MRTHVHVSSTRTTSTIIVHVHARTCQVRKPNKTENCTWGLYTYVDVSGCTGAGLRNPHWRVLLLVNGSSCIRRAPPVYSAADPGVDTSRLGILSKTEISTFVERLMVNGRRHRTTSTRTWTVRGVRSRSAPNHWTL
jgi:hypothetical protein